MSHGRAARSSLVVEYSLNVEYSVVVECSEMIECSLVAEYSLSLPESCCADVCVATDAVYSCISGKVRSASSACAAAFAGWTRTPPS